LQYSLTPCSNSQYAETGKAFGEKATDVNLVKAAGEVIDKPLGRRLSA
jgi:hypothetical protein